MTLGVDLKDALETVYKKLVQMGSSTEQTHIAEVETLSSTLVPIANEDDGLAVKGLERGVFLVENLRGHREQDLCFVDLFH
jgi:hypothetical protein